MGRPAYDPHLTSFFITSTTPTAFSHCPSFPKTSTSVLNVTTLGAHWEGGRRGARGGTGEVRRRDVGRDARSDARGGAR